MTTESHDSFDRRDPPPRVAPVGDSVPRHGAEERSLRVDGVPLPPTSPEEAQRLLQELRTHQVELESQNEELRRIQAALELSQRRYFDLYDLAPVGYLTLSDTGLIEEANLTATNLLGTARSSLVGLAFSDFILPEDQESLYRGRQQLWSSGERQTIELRLEPAEGRPIWVRLDTSLAPETTASPGRWRIVLTDISASKQSDQALRRSQARLGLAAEIAGLTFCEWDPNRDTLTFPPNWQRQMGYAPNELPWRLSEWAEFLHPEDRERSLLALGLFAANPGNHHEIQFRSRRKDGIYRWFAVRLEALRDEVGALERVLLVHQDITERKESEDRAIHLARHDALTGLPTRALFEQLAHRMIAGARRSHSQLALLFLDLDRFKAVNDVHGHEMGDQLLRGVARRLRETFRSDDLVARLGGDEFVIVLGNLRDAEDAARSARHLIAALTPPYRFGDVELQCVPSIGISLFPQDGDSVGTLLRRADLAMYHAKQISPGQYQFVTEEMNRKVQARATLEERLRLSMKRGELRLAYQPVLDLRSGQVTGVEALLRWPQSDRSEITPAIFLPIAESSRLMHEMGQWVLGEACRQHLAWLAAGLPAMPIALNVSNRQFHHPGFQEQFAAICATAGVEPAVFTLQMSEETLLLNLESSMRVLAALRVLGVRLVLDDFGLGCSSLSELEQMPLDGLEINRTLVRRMSATRSMPAIVDAIIHLGQALRLEVAAVGIETEADLRFFRGHGCYQVQGFYLGAPMTGDKLAAWYRARPA
ncbi:EAL domain-containing protein [Thiocystis violacea]|uniref:sensor domain-containing protein n=1 Tax=Thiocystis violacea TaxID=13725 RepID=UPI0019066494|nr:EAL domain-containing protein [Thiocystis violacea]MBK1719451.1 GGDEF domain-containing protein [Thiocystis violacea]